MLADLPDADSHYVRDAVELRHHLARALQGGAEAIVKDSVAIYAFAGMENVGTDDRARLADLILQLITSAVRDGALDARGAPAAELGLLASEKDVAIALLFSVVYLMERSALDELAVDDSFGASSETWPSIVQIVRRASFDVCAAFSEQLRANAGDTGIIDSLTTLHTRPVFLAALEKEIQRSERFGHPFAVILLNVDRLEEINVRHGYGAGDRVLERVGIVVRSYFRETDWVARSAGDTFAVLLPETQPANAERLAERIRTTVEERLQLHDYRSEEQFPVTVSAGVLIKESVDQTVRAEQLLMEAEQAVDRAKKAGGNRVERVDAGVGG